MSGMFAGLLGRAVATARLDQPAEFEYYVSEFSRTGFTGALNWYRNYDRNWESTRSWRMPTSKCLRCSSAAPPTHSSDHEPRPCR